MEQRIYSARVCGYLCDKGLNYIRKERNPKEPKLWVFIFEKTPEFDSIYNDIIKTHFRSQ